MKDKQLACAFVAAMSAAIAGDAPRQSVATFRSSANAVLLDVSVLDRQGRPITGLQASDFTVLDGGVPERIALFDAIDLPQVAAVPGGAPEATPDVTTNDDLDQGRVIAVMMDDAIPMPVGEGSRAKDAARAVIDQLGPHDRAAVMFAADHSAGQDFTLDRARLRAAVDKFKARIDLHSVADPTSSSGTTAANFTRMDQSVTTLYLTMLGTLKTLIDGLADLPQRRKAVVLVSVGLPLDLSQTGLLSDTDPHGLSGRLSDQIEAILQAADRASVTVYAIDPGGLRGSSSDMQSDDIGSDSLNREFLRSLADNTGGFAVVGANDVRPGAAQILRESGSYYLLGYQSAATGAPGSARRVQITVDRADATVHTRSQAFTPPATSKPGAAPLARALHGLLPDADVAMTLTAAPFAAPTAGQTALAIVIGLRQNAPPDMTRAVEKLEVIVNAYDADGKSAASRTTNVSAELPPARTNVQYEVLSRLDLKPGRYQLRVAAQTSLDGHVGSVFTDVEVPDFRKAPLSMSGIVFSAVPGRLAAPRDALQALLPVTPTSAREFDARQRVTALFDVYEGGARPIVPVDLVVQIVNAAGVMATRVRETIDAARFSGARSAEYRVGIPTGALDAGSYVLDVAMTPHGAPAGTAPVHARIPFSIRKAG